MIGVVGGESLFMDDVVGIDDDVVGLVSAGVGAKNGGSLGY